MLKIFFRRTTDKEGKQVRMLCVHPGERDGDLDKGMEVQVVRQAGL